MINNSHMYFIRMGAYSLEATADTLPDAKERALAWLTRYAKGEHNMPVEIYMNRGMYWELLMLIRGKPDNG